MAKLAFVLLAAMCLAQGLNAFSCEQNNKKDISSDIIDKSIVSMTDAIRNVHDNLDPIIEKCRVDIEKAADKLIAEVKVAIDEAIASLEGLTVKIEKLRTESSTCCCCRAKCLEGLVDEAEQIEEDTIEMIQCQYKGYADKIAAEVKATFETVVAKCMAELDKIERELESCLSTSGGHHSIDEAVAIYKCACEKIQYLMLVDDALEDNILCETIAGERKVAKALVAIKACIAAEEESAWEKEEEIIRKTNICLGNTP